MKNAKRYHVCTHWGEFSLNEGAYQDYLAGKLWITWKPGQGNGGGGGGPEPPGKLPSDDSDVRSEIVLTLLPCVLGCQTLVKEGAAK